MTSLEIEVVVAHMFQPRQNLIVPNVSWGMGLRYECDLLILTPSGYATEIEIKTSKSDLIRDKQKKHNHDSVLIKNLYFAIPSELAKWWQHIPGHAGIIVVNSKSKAFIIAKPIPRNTRKWGSNEKAQLARLGALRIWGLKGKILRLQSKRKKEE